jgi:hypothetical protein
VSIIQTNFGSGSSSSYTASFNQNVQAGSSILVAVVCNENLFTSASVSDTQGNTYTLIKMSARLTAGGGFFWTAIYAANNAAAGPDTITTTFSGSTLGSTNFTLIAEVNGPLAGLDGVATAGVVGNSGDSFPSLSLPVTNAGELAFTFLGCGSCNNGSAPSGFSSFFVPSPTSTWAIAWTQTPTVGTNTIQWGGTVTSGNFNIPISMVAASFFLTPQAPSPVKAVAGNRVGNAIQFFGVNSTTPATVQTQSNTQQLFTFDTTSRPGVTQLFRYADDANFLGRTAMPGQLLVLPGNGWFRGTQYFVCASGTVTIPLSAQNSGVSFTLYSNKFQNLTPGNGLNIQVSSDVLATLPNSPLSPTLNSYQWSLVGALGGTLLGAGPNAGTSPASCAATWNLNGVVIGASGSSIIDNGLTGPKLQMSLGVQFSGTVSGNDQFQATCSQFEIQEA